MKGNVQTIQSGGDRFLYNLRYYIDGRNCLQDTLSFDDFID